MSIGALAEEILIKLASNKFGRLGVKGSTAVSFETWVYNVEGAKWNGQDAMKAVKQLDDNLLIDKLSDSVFEITTEGREQAKSIHPFLVIIHRKDGQTDLYCRSATLI